MNIQDWLTQLLARPAADPLDWESYSVTMEAAIWKALWRDIDATQAYEDGLEASFRLLQATHQHRSQLRPKDYHARQVLLYGSILAMLDKADRWETYLAAWETIRARTRHCVPAGDIPCGSPIPWLRPSSSGPTAGSASRRSRMPCRCRSPAPCIPSPATSVGRRGSNGNWSRRGQGGWWRTVRPWDGTP